MCLFPLYYANTHELRALGWKNIREEAQRDHTRHTTGEMGQQSMLVRSGCKWRVVKGFGEGLRPKQDHTRAGQG